MFEEMAEADTFAMFKRHVDRCLIGKALRDIGLMQANGIIIDQHHA